MARPRWYCVPVERPVAPEKPTQGTAEQWLGCLKYQSGVKTEQVEDLYIQEWMRELDAPGVNSERAVLVEELVVRVGLLKPLAIYQQRDLFGLQPGLDSAQAARQHELFERAGPAWQGNMFGLVDPKTQAAADRGRQLDDAKAKADDNLRVDKSVPADIGRRGGLFTTQKELLDERSTGGQGQGEALRQDVDYPLPVREGSTARQLELRDELIDELGRRLGGSRGVALLGAALPRAFKGTSQATIVGQTAREIAWRADVVMVIGCTGNPNRIVTLQVPPALRTNSCRWWVPPVRNGHWSRQALGKPLSDLGGN